MSATNKTYLIYALTIEGDLKTTRYIGVTSLTIEKRFRSHKYCATHPAKCGLPVHKWMKSIYDKNMKIVPIKIDECDEENWEEKEIYYIQKYKNEGFRLLNVDKGGNGVVTAEKRSKSSLARCGEKHWKAIVAFNLDGSFYKEYPSITAANKEFGSKSMFNIGNVLRGPGKSAFGYIWKYKSECTEELLSNGIEPYSIDRHSKKIYQFNLDGTLYKEYEAITDYDSNTWANRGISRAINLKCSYRDFYWSFNLNIDVLEYTSPFKYKVTNIITNESKSFKYMFEFSKYIGLARSNMSRKFSEFGNEFKYNGFIIKRNIN